MTEQDFSIRYTEISELGEGLSVVAEELDASERIADDHGDHVSNSMLAEALESFASNWSDKRQELVDDIRGIAAFAQAAGDTFQGLDLELEDATKE
ncbi:MULTISPECIES: hypothetical protein [Streptomyces]|uniref:hypothetical protein n=1 Tax=Streptomyces TaxID=1883 RepID=UPI000CD4AFD7|nr:MULTISPECIES: hypothetical protein [Streptomyces]